MSTFAPRTYHARRAMASFINARKGEIEANLSTLEPAAGKLTVLDHYSNNVNAQEFPLLMLEQTGVERDWESLDTGSGPTYHLRFFITIWGLVHGFQDSVMEDLISELEGSLGQVLNRRHESFQFEDWEFYFKETLPMPESSFGTTKLAMGVARGFTSVVRVDSLVTAPQQPGT